MTRNYLSVCFLSIAAYLVDNTAGNESIINGEKATVDQYPYQVSVQAHVDEHTPGQHTCGGGIISEKFILTAAHCFIVPDNQFKPFNWSVVAGTNDLRSRSVRAVRIMVKKIYVPTEYSPPVYRTTGDIAVIKLTEPFKLKTNQRYLIQLDLPPKSKRKQSDYVDEVVKIAGFGWDWIQLYRNGSRETGGRNFTQLRYTESKVITNEQCQTEYPQRNICDQHLCSRSKPYNLTTSRGVCTGDSGGPVVLNRTVIGILSSSPFGCMEEVQAAVYTRVSDYLKFIKHAMKGKNDKKTRLFVP